MVTRQRPRSTRLLVVVLVSVSLAVITLDYREGEDGPLAGARRRRQAVHGADAGGRHQRHAADRRLLLRPGAPAVAGATRTSGCRTSSRPLASRGRGVRSMKAEYERAARTCSACRRPSTPTSVAAVRHRQRRVELRVHGHDRQGLERRDRGGPAGGDRVARRRPCWSAASSSVSPDSADVRLIIDRDSAVRGRSWATPRKPASIQGQGDARPADDRSSSPAPWSKASETGLHAGLRGRRSAGPVSARPADRPGLPHRAGRQRDRRSSSRSGPRSTSRRCSSCWCCRPGRRRRRSDPPGAVDRRGDRHRACCCSRPSSGDLKLLGVRPELMYLVTIVIAILEGPQRRCRRRVRRRAWPRTSC